MKGANHVEQAASLFHARDDFSRVFQGTGPGQSIIPPSRQRRL